ncbi:MAG: hypothetical protein E4G74_00140 [Erysipelotrichales bacterium]|nr:MAG: hypothetical protein E4G74_00140 [Erysipelotrichales bacterium]
MQERGRELTMWIITFAILLAFVFVYLNAVPYMRLKKFLSAQADSGRTYTCHNDSKIWVGVQVAMILLSIFFGYMDRQNMTTIAIAIALSGSFAGNILAAQANRTVYYSETGFVMNLKYVPYKSIKDFTRKRGVLRTVDVWTYSGDTGKLTPGCAQKIKAMKEEREKRKEK